MGQLSEGLCRTRIQNKFQAKLPQYRVRWYLQIGVQELWRQEFKIQRTLHPQFILRLPDHRSFLYLYSELHSSEPTWSDFVHGQTLGKEPSLRLDVCTRCCLFHQK